MNRLVPTGVVVLALAITGCSTAPAESSANTESTETAGYEFCETYAAGFMGYTDWVASTATESVDVSEFEEQASFISDLRTTATEDIDSQVEDLALPVDAVQEVIDSGGGPISFSTDSFKSAQTPILDYCTDEVGYSAG